ncbi:MAG: c-type cytochrome [Gammaproteobacteria bacterium]|nr:c-type cytochrome [Gammaproteobacteria bacterium]
MAPVPTADDPLALAKSYGCLVCHTIDKKTIGPAWKDVAAKYRGDKGAEARLMDKVAKGGSGVWGNVMMPPNPKPSEAERRKLVRFVLSLN